MNDFALPLMLELDVVSLTMSLVNIASPHGDETGLADSIEEALTPLAHLDVERIGHTVVARTSTGGQAGERLLVACHLDTAADSDAAAFVEMGKLVGPGACDAKGGLAVMLRAAVSPYDRDVTFVFYDGAEGDAGSGLAGLASTSPEMMAVDVAVLVEPTGGGVSLAGAGHPELSRLAASTEAAPLAPPTCGATRLLTSLGIPTAAFGPGDPSLAHSADEFVPTAELTECEFVLRTWLQGSSASLR